jgi:hypothetical protein
MDCHLANRQDEENDDLIDLDFSDDEDFEQEEEPQKTVPAPTQQTFFHMFN